MQNLSAAVNRFAWIVNKVFRLLLLFSHKLQWLWRPSWCKWFHQAPNVYKDMTSG